jgi:hypothetical protein
MTHQSIPEPIVIGEFQANAREVARVSLETFNGSDLVQVRKWFRADDGKLHPGKRGIAVNVRHLPRLVELLTSALKKARVLRLIDGETSQ